MTRNVHPLSLRGSKATAAIFFVVSLFFTTTALAHEFNLPFTVPKNPLVLPEFALIDTTKGPVEIKFHRELAPVTVKNFEYLGRKGFYNGIAFHKIRSGFAVEGGDPSGTGKGGAKHYLPPEYSSLKHKSGSIGMTRLPGPVNPNRYSNGSIFYITLREAKHFDGLYTIFAEVINGLDIVGSLEMGDKIKGVYFPKKKFNSKQ